MAEKKNETPEVSISVEHIAQATVELEARIKALDEREKAFTERVLSAEKEIAEALADIEMQKDALDERENFLEVAEAKVKKQMILAESADSGFDHIDGKITVARVDGRLARTLSRKGVDYIPRRSRDTGDTPLYTIPSEYAQLLLTEYSDRYKLVNPAVLLCRRETNGGREEVAVEAVTWDEKSQSWK